MSAAGDRIRGFDGLRALALVAVFLQHYTPLGRDYETGGYGVWLFFALSGFLIVRILVAERRRMEAGDTAWSAALGRFFWRRTLRIWPAYYLALGVFTVLAAVRLVDDFPLKDAWWHYAYLSNVYFGEVLGRWIGRFGHFWSLAVEEQFYLLAAPLLILAPSRWARGLCAAVVLASLSCNLAMRSSGATAMALYTHPLINFGALAFGGWIGLGAPARPAGGSASWPALGCLGAMVAFIVGFHHIGAMPEGAALMVAAAPFLFATVAGGLALLAVYLNQQSLVVRALEWGPIAYFGRVSYGFYLYHNLLPRWLVTRLAQGLGFDWRAPWWLEAGVSFALALGVAALSWAVLEKPILRLKDRVPRLPGWRSRKAAPAAA